MGIWVKTTVDIVDPLFCETKRVAAAEGTTIRALIEAGLRSELKRRTATRGFRLRDESFGGEGLQPGVAEGGWERIRDMIYEGRGG